MSKKFHGDSVKNESAKAKKLEKGAPNPPPPPPACLGLITLIVRSYSKLVFQSQVLRNIILIT